MILRRILEGRPSALLAGAADQTLRGHSELTALSPRLRVNAWNWASPPARVNRHPPAVAAVWVELREEAAAVEAVRHLGAFADLLRGFLVAKGIDAEDAALIQVGCVTAHEIQRIGGYFGFDRELWPLTATGRIDMRAAL